MRQYIVWDQIQVRSNKAIGDLALQFCCEARTLIHRCSIRAAPLIMSLAKARRNCLATAVASILLLAPHYVMAQTAAPAQQPAIELSITGRVAHPRRLALADLQALPATNVEITQGPHIGAFTGALMWSLLDAASPVDEVGQKTSLQHGMITRGRDGYGVLVAIGEVSPELEGKQVLVAYARDGKPLTSLLLIVPADKRGSRFVLDLVAIEVR